MEDSLFKTIFTSKELRNFVAYIISKILKIDENYVKEKMIVLNTNSINENKTNKKSISDIIIQVENNIINIECNRWYYNGLLERNNYYLASIMKNSISTKEEYDKYNFIQINLNDFSINKTKRIINKCYQMMDKKELDILVDNQKIYEISIENINKKWYNNCKLTKLEKYIYSLKSNNAKILLELSEEDEEIKKVVKTIMEYNCDNKWDNFFDYEADYQRTINTIVSNARKEINKAKKEINKAKEANEKAKEAGKKEGIFTTIKNMLKNGIDLNMISKCTGVTKKEIEKINEGLKIPN